jgi:hypothetical protein
MSSFLNSDNGFEPSAYRDDKKPKTLSQQELRQQSEEAYPEYSLDDDTQPEPPAETFGSSYLISKKTSDEIIKNRDEKERKQKFLTNGSQCATNLLEERAKLINNTKHNIHHVIEHVGRISSPVGVFAGCMMDGLVGGALGQVISTYGTKFLHRTNNKVAARQLKFVDRTIKAIEECNNPNINIEKKKEDYEIILRTANFIENFEKSEKLLNITGRFCLTLSLDLPISILEFGAKVYSTIRGKPKHVPKQEKHSTSEDLMHNLIDMGFALGFHDIDPDVDPEITKPKNHFEEKVLSYIMD